jgi:predicted outer membrane repeat protein
MGTRRTARIHTRRMRRAVLFVAAAVGLMVSGSLAVSGATPAGASDGEITVHCPDDDLGFVIFQAAPGSTIVIDGTCIGNFYIDKDLTLKGPAVLDGGGTTQVLNVAAGTVVVNDLTIQNAGPIFGGGGLWNGGQLTLNNSTVTNNHTANGFGGVFNFGQLTLNNSTVSHNSGSGGGGIFNCAASLHEFGLCTGAPGTLTLNSSTVSDNAATFNGGGIANDAQANLTVNNSSTVSGNTAGASGGGISNDGTATLSRSTVSNNNSTGGGPPSWNGGGGIANTGPMTLNNSVVQGNSAAFIGGGIYAAGAMTINNGTVSDNSAGPVGGGMVAWDGPTMVNGSVFSNNTDGGFFPDDPAGVWVAPMNFGGFFVNNPSFTTHHSSFS